MDPINWIWQHPTPSPQPYLRLISALSYPLTTRLLRVLWGDYFRLTLVSIGVRLMRPRWALPWLAIRNKSKKMGPPVRAYRAAFTGVRRHYPRHPLTKIFAGGKDPGLSRGDSGSCEPAFIFLYTSTKILSSAHSWRILEYIPSG